MLWCLISLISLSRVVFMSAPSAINNVFLKRGHYHLDIMLLYYKRNDDVCVCASRKYDYDFVSFNYFQYVYSWCCRKSKSLFTFLILCCRVSLVGRTWNMEYDFHYKTLLFHCFGATWNVIPGYLLKLECGNLVLKTSPGIFKFLDYSREPERKNEAYSM